MAATIRNFRVNFLERKFTFSSNLLVPLGTNFNQNSNIFIHENAFESIVCELATILSRPQCVN